MTQNLFWILGVEAMMGAQGVEFRAPHVTSPRLLAVKAAVRAKIAPLAEDRYMAPDLAAAGDLIASGALAEAAGAEILPGLSA